MWLLTFKLIKMRENKKFSRWVTLAYFIIVTCDLWLVVVDLVREGILEGTKTGRA
jgi:hypothetical protein